MKINIGSSGQVALIVLLISAVVMTIGLSVSKKTVVDTKIEAGQEQLKQAFNTAESGLDYYFGTGSTKFTAVDNNSTADITVKNIGGGSTTAADQFILSGGNVGIWMVGHDSDGNIDYSSYFKGSLVTLCFSNSLSAGAIKLDYFYRQAGSYQVKRMGYNLLSNAVSGFTNFAVAPVQGGCIANYRSIALPLTITGVTPLILTARMINTSGKIYLIGTGDTFPIQGIAVSSTGRVGDVSTGTNVNRSLEVKRTYQIPGFAFEGVTTFGSVLSN